MCDQVKLVAHVRYRGAFGCRFLFHHGVVLVRNGSASDCAAVRLNAPKELGSFDPDRTTVVNWTGGQAGGTLTSAKGAEIAEISWNEFVRLGREGNAHFDGIDLVHYPKPTADVHRMRLERAMGSLGHRGLWIARDAEGKLCHGYSVLRWNCEHFAVWCMTGEARSRQVERGAAAAQAVFRGIGEILTFSTPTAKTLTAISILRQFMMVLLNMQFESTPQQISNDHTAVTKALDGLSQEVAKQATVVIDAIAAWNCETDLESLIMRYKSLLTTVAAAAADVGLITQYATSVREKALDVRANVNTKLRVPPPKESSSDVDVKEPKSDVDWHDVTELYLVSSVAAIMEGHAHKLLGAPPATAVQPLRDASTMVRNGIATLLVRPLFGAGLWQALQKLIDLHHDLHVEFLNGASHQAAVDAPAALGGLWEPYATLGVSEAVQALDVAHAPAPEEKEAAAGPPLPRSVRVERAALEAALPGLHRLVEAVASELRALEDSLPARHGHSLSVEHSLAPTATQPQTFAQLLLETADAGDADDARFLVAFLLANAKRHPHLVDDTQVDQRGALLAAIAPHDRDWALLTALLKGVGGSAKWEWSKLLPVDELLQRDNLGAARIDRQQSRRDAARRTAKAAAEYGIDLTPPEFSGEIRTTSAPSLADIAALGTLVVASAMGTTPLGALVATGGLLFSGSSSPGRYRDIVWAVDLASGSRLYISAPMSELSVENSRAFLLARGPAPGNASVVGTLASMANDLMQDRAAPRLTRLEVYYDVSLWGDLEPVAQRACYYGFFTTCRCYCCMTRAARDFCVACVTLLPEHNVTLLRSGGRAAPLRICALDPVAIPAASELDAEPFSSWKLRTLRATAGAGGLSLAELADPENGIAEYLAGKYRGRGTLVFTSTSSTTVVSGDFDELKIIGIGSKQLGEPRALNVRLQFTKAGEVRPSAVVIIRRSLQADPVILLRTEGGLISRGRLRRVNGAVAVRVNFA